jgi:hypothetical protein
MSARPRSPLIERGAQNLPGNWESSKFNLPECCIPQFRPSVTRRLLSSCTTTLSLSEIPYMRDAERWGILTIGTGLGNARFTNRKVNEE